jgi:hypothetical protein
VEPAHFRKFDDCSPVGRLDVPRLRRILFQGQMGSRTVVVAQILAKNPSQVVLVEHEERADQARVRACY